VALTQLKRKQDPMTTSAAPRPLTIEHVVIASNQPYDKVLEGLASRMGSEEGWRQTEQRVQELTAAQAPLAQAEETIERQLGTSDFTIFKTVEHTPLHRLAGKTSRAVQYMAGNPLLANQMSRIVPEVALYAPLHFVVYEDDAGKTFVAYDNFVSLLAQYQSEEINQVAQVVEQKLEALLTAVTQ
jgi:uncharacterized protein (DUF302 family)